MTTFQAIAELCVLDLPIELEIESEEDSQSEAEKNSQSEFRKEGVMTVEMFDRAMAIAKSGRGADFTEHVIFDTVDQSFPTSLPLTELNEDELLLRKMISEGRLTFFVDYKPSQT